jgi:hypothetical protein
MIMKRTHSTKPISQSKSRTNKYKCGHMYRNIMKNKTFRIVKKMWFDIAWVYLIKYEDGTQNVTTEASFKFLVEKKRFERINTKSSKAVTVHFDDTELFEIE